MLAYLKDKTSEQKQNSLLALSSYFANCENKAQTITNPHPQIDTRLDNILMSSKDLRDAFGCGDIRPESLKKDCDFF